MATLAILIVILVGGCRLMFEVKAISRFLQHVYEIQLFLPIHAAETLNLMLLFYSMLVQLPFFLVLSVCGPVNT